MGAPVRQALNAGTGKPKSELQRLRQIERLAKWAVERDAALTVAAGRSEVLRLFAEDVRSVLNDSRTALLT